MIVDEMCVMCESGAEENVEHLLVTCCHRVTPPTLFKTNSSGVTTTILSIAI